MAAEKRIQDIKELEVKEINKRRSGEAFEVILKHPNDEGVHTPIKSPQPKKEVSIEEIQLKMQAAEDRRRAKQEAVINQLKAEEEKMLKVKQKKAEANDCFSSWAEERLKNKMSQYEENYGSVLQARINKFKALNMKPEELKEKINREIDDMCQQREEQLLQKLSKTEQLRQKQLQNVRIKQQEKENHAQQVRQKKQEQACGDN